jgi:hypothetical protein
VGHRDTATAEIPEVVQHLVPLLRIGLGIVLDDPEHLVAPLAARRRKDDVVLGRTGE